MSKGSVLVTPKSLQTSEKARSEGGRYIPCPTLSEAYYRYTSKKGWWAARDILIRDFLGMAMLEPPWGEDKGATQTNGTRLENGDVQFDVSSFPFNVSSQAQAMLADSHPYVDVNPAAEGHTDKTMADCERFLQAALDDWMGEHNLVSEAMGKLMHTGWLVLFHPYDPARKLQKEFPFPLRIMSPLGVYPDFNADKRINFITYERVVSGAELRQDYIGPDGKTLPGIAALLDGEPDPDILSDGEKKQRGVEGYSLDTMRFRVVRYYDDTYTALFIDCDNALGNATQYNSVLANMVKRAGKGLPGISALGDIDDEDNPFWGVMEHKLGGVPFTIRGCWPEPRDASSTETDALSGRYGWLPFLYPVMNDWKTMSAVLSKLHTALLNWALPQKLAKLPRGTDVSGEIVWADEGSDQDMKFITPPPFPPEANQLLQMLKEEMSKSSFGDAVYGARGGTSGAQQNNTLDAGSVKLDVPKGEIERGVAGALRGILRTMIFRGPGEYTAAGNGRKYGGKAYVSTYDIDGLKEIAPKVVVSIKKVNGVKDPTMVAAYKSLQGILPDIYLLENLLDEPNGKKLLEDMRDEAAMKNQEALLPYVELAVKKATLETLKPLEELTWKLESLQAKLDLQTRMREIEQDMGQMPLEKAKEMAQKTMLDIYQQAGIQPPLMLPPSPGMLPTQPPPNMPPPPGSGGPMPSMPPQSGLPSPPMNISMPQGTPSLPGSMPGGPMMAPPSMPQGPPLLPPGMPPMGMMPPPRSSLPLGMPSGGSMGMVSSLNGRPMLPPPRGMGQIAKAPGQAQQPIQPLSRFNPIGGVGRPGVDSLVVGPGGRPGQPTPEIAAANAAVAPIMPLPAPTLGRDRNRPTRRGRSSTGRKTA